MAEGWRLLTTKEVAQAMNMSTGSIYRLMRAGILPAYSAGPGLTGVRFDLAEVKQALRRRPASTAAEAGECVVAG